MKALSISFAWFTLLVGIAVAGQDTNPAAVAIVSAIPSATRLVATSWGYRVDTPTGTRNVYTTSTGYRIEGGPGAPNLTIRKTSTGYLIENSAIRGAALGSR